MNKTDLKEVLGMMDGKEKDESPPRISKEEMCEFIIQTFPDMKAEVEVLNDHEIEEYYHQLKEKLPEKS